MQRRVILVKRTRHGLCIPPVVFVNSLPNHRMEAGCPVC
jgi:hypothetical protein